jgi:hypothetical protein
MRLRSKTAKIFGIFIFALIAIVLMLPVQLVSANVVPTVGCYPQESVKEVIAGDFVNTSFNVSISNAEDLNLSLYIFLLSDDLAGLKIKWYVDGVYKGETTGEAELKEGSKVSIPITNGSYSITAEIHVPSNVKKGNYTLYLRSALESSGNGITGTNSDVHHLTLAIEEKPSPCFIATAVYGTVLHEDIEVLRDFRDEYLITNPIGREFVGIYYTTSPPIADVIRENEGLRTIVREGLVKPLVYITRKFVG